jgi:Transposase
MTNRRLKPHRRPCAHFWSGSKPYGSPPGREEFVAPAVDNSDKVFGTHRQRLKPYEKFAAMIERHWDGIAAYCRRENKVSLGFVEGLNNKIRVIQRRAYGLKNEEYFRLKVLTRMLPEL